MEELFNDISVDKKKQHQLFIDLTLMHNGPISAVNKINDYANFCSQRERDFIHFYLKTLVERKNNESNNDQR